MEMRYPLYSRIQEKTGLDIMPSGNRYWLEYDSVALAVLLMGIGLVGLIVLII